MQLVKESESVSAFIRDMTKLVDQRESGVFDVCPPSHLVDYYIEITDHLAKVGWDK